MMMYPEKLHKVVGLAFEKDISELPFYEFEKVLIYGVCQTLNLFTNIGFLDYAVPSNRLMVRNHIREEEDLIEMLQIGARYHARYLFHGGLKPEIREDLSLDGIHIEIKLFDTLKSEYMFQLRYYFTSFEGSHAKAALFTPTWSGMQNLIAWTAFSILGAIEAEQSLAFWHKISHCQLASSLKQFHHLATAHYLNMDTEGEKKVDILFKLAEADPNLFLAHLELGFIYKRMQEYAAALPLIEAAFKKLKEATPSIRAYIATEAGVCNALIEDADKACHWWKLAIYEDPTYLNPYLNLAHTLEEQERLDEAEHFFKQASEIAPNDLRIYFNLARIYSKQEKWEQAIVQYQKQLALEPDNAWLSSDLANCYLQVGQIKEAMVYLSKTAELDPEGEAGRCALMILEGLKAAAEIN